MAEREAAAGQEPEEAAGASGPTGELRPSAVDPAAVVLAVERLADDVAALRRTVAAQPEEVAARLDVDASTAAVGVRVGALGATLDQLRLSLLAALDRTAERLDTPSWLPDLQARLEELAPSSGNPGWLPGLHVAVADVGSRLDVPPWLPELQRRLGDLVPLAADHQKLRQAVAQLVELERSISEAGRAAPLIEAIEATGIVERLDEIGTGVATVASADAAGRLVRVEQAVSDLADGVRAGAAVADALDHLGQRLVGIEDAAGRVADDARRLIERVAPVPERLNAIATQVDRITPLARAADRAGSLFDRLDRVEAGLEEAVALLRARGEGGAGLDHNDFDGVIDVLAGVSRRQDQVIAAVAALVDQVRGPRNIDAVFDRMEQRERSLAARLDRIDADLRRLGSGAPAGGAPPVPSEAHDDDAPGSLAGSVEAIATITEGLAHRMESTAERLDRRLSRIEAELHGSAGAAPPAAASPRKAPSPEAVMRLARLRAERAQVQARLQEERLLASRTWDDES